MSTTRPRKDSTVLAPIDIAEQPVGALIFLTEGASGTQAFAVDSITIQDEVVHGYRHEVVGADTPFGYVAQTLVIAVPVRSPWTVIARNACIFRTLEESMRKTRSDKAQEADLVKEVFGEAHEAPTAAPAFPMLKPPGHYL